MSSYLSNGRQIPGAPIFARIRRSPSAVSLPSAIGGCRLASVTSRQWRSSARRIHALLAQEQVAPQAIHAHKLCFEGIVAWLLARRLGVPFVASLRGEAGTKIIRFKPSYRPLIKRVARDARIVFAVSMWFVPELKHTVPCIEEKIRPLPNLVPPTHAENGMRVPAAPRFVSVLDLNVYRKKGFHWLISALALAAKKHPDVTLDVFGWSNERVDREIRKLARVAGCTNRIRFRGVRPHAQIIDELPEYVALLLPSVNETFGMVYLEALLAGVPVLYTRGTGIDGHLDGLRVGVGVTAGAVEEIAAAIDGTSPATPPNGAMPYGVNALTSSRASDKKKSSLATPTTSAPC